MARRALLVCGVVLVVAVAAGAWLTLDALRARSELQAAAADVTQLQAQVTTGDRAAATTTLGSLQGHAENARGLTQGPHWAVAGRLPWAGPNVLAVQAVSEVVDGLATQALPNLMDATALVDPSTLAPVDGRVDLQPLRVAADQVVAADASVQTAVERLAAIDTGPLVDVVAGPITQVRRQLDEVAMTTATAARAVRLLPPMLGADGPREYLVLVQNNAEQRATGGIPGSVVLVRAEAGAVEVVDQRTGGSLSGLSEPVVPLTDAETVLFGDEMATDMRNVTMTPDFPRTGEIAQGIWQTMAGSELDGVVSIDPGALALVLGATGPVTLESSQALTEDNAVQLLLNTIYLEEDDPAAQDAFFAQTSASVFGAITGGQGDPVATVDALAEAARQGRLMVWSAHPGEQALLTGTVLSGELRGRDDTSPVVGVYLNDASASKMGYYLDVDVDVETQACRPDGSQTIGLTVTMTSTAPADAATLPPYLTGRDRSVVPAGDVRTNVLVYAPVGGFIEDVRVKDDQVGGFAQVHDGQAVLGRTVQLSPGERLVTQYTVVSGPRQTGPVALRVTPVTTGTLGWTGPTSCS